MSSFKRLFYNLKVVMSNFESKPFYSQTETLFRSVEHHDFDTLANLCKDDFGIVDIDPEGKNVIISTRQEWEDWFRTLFRNLDSMNAKTWTDILDYQAIQEDRLGYSVVNFRQNLEVNGQTSKFYCVATIVWKKVDEEWKEARWHASVIRVEQ